jgi:serine/threonine protein kinase
MDPRRTSISDQFGDAWSPRPDAVPAEPARAASPSRPGGQTELRPGVSIGPYRLIQTAGVGGMAEVWRAYDARLERYVAIKFLSSRHATDASYLDRFLHEARAVSRLDHANVLTVLDFGEQDGWTYMVNPYIGGGTLADRLHRGPWPIAEAITVLGELAAALDYAHGEGIVHRDVKPSNVLFTERGRLVLSDFGVAQMLESTTFLHDAGRIIGTPMYMSPEQADGQHATAASDLYSLGVVAYEMLTGRPPYMAETPLALLRSHLDKPLPPPRQLNPGLPEAVEAALFKVMAKDPADRFASGKEFVAALRVPLVRRPTIPPPPGPPPPAPTRGGPAFSYLFKLSHQRSILQAIIFYVVFAVATFGPLVIVQLVLNVLIGNLAAANELGFRIGVLVAATVPFGLSFAILASKRLLAHPIYVVALVASPVLGWFGGVFLGLIVPTLLSARPMHVD